MSRISEWSLQEGRDSPTFNVEQLRIISHQHWQRRRNSSWGIMNIGAICALQATASLKVAAQLNLHLSIRALSFGVTWGLWNLFLHFASITVVPSLRVVRRSIVVAQALLERVVFSPSDPLVGQVSLKDRKFCVWLFVQHSVI